MGCRCFRQGPVRELLSGTKGLTSGLKRKWEKHHEEQRTQFNLSEDVIKTGDEHSMAAASLKMLYSRFTSILKYRRTEILGTLKEEFRSEKRPTCRRKALGGATSRSVTGGGRKQVGVGVAWLWERERITL